MTVTDKCLLQAERKKNLQKAIDKKFPDLYNILACI